MQLQDLKYDKSRSFMVNTVTKKEYKVIKHKGKERYYIQHSKGQLTVTSLVNSPEREYDIFSDYVLSGLMQTHPCHAMTYWCLVYRSFKKLSFY